jgi:DNA repair protein RecN (Recombination protein N)
VDVHGQNEHQRILLPSVQLDLLDRFAGLEKEVEALAPLFREWQALSARFSQGRLSEQARLQRLDLFRFQLQELDAAKLAPGEEAALEARLPELKNAGKLRALSETVYGLLYQDEGSALERLGQAQRSFEALKGFAPALEPLYQELLEAKGRLEETARALQSAAERWDADPAALEALLGRLDQIARLKKKYGASAEGLREKAEALRQEVDQLENSDTYQKELERQVEKSRQALEEASLALSARRKKAAKELGSAVQKQLGDLGLKQALFRCQIEASLSEGDLRFTLHGVDRAVFEWAPNPGEGVQPLKMIASGGEMSRVMLALKTVLAEADAVPTLVFDEVDAGIGGVTAQTVGKKLRGLSRHHQILCVSHLPQIASFAHAHFQVAKRVTKQRTTAEVARLESTERLHELARLLGSAVTPTSLQHAKEMLAQNQ